MEGSEEAEALGLECTSADDRRLFAFNLNFQRAVEESAQRQVDEMQKEVRKTQHQLSHVQAVREDLGVALHASDRRAKNFKRLANEAKEAGLNLHNRARLTSKAVSTMQSAYSIATISPMVCSIFCKIQKQHALYSQDSLQSLISRLSVLILMERQMTTDNSEERYRKFIQYVNETKEYCQENRVEERWVSLLSFVSKRAINLHQTQGRKPDAFHRFQQTRFPESPSHRRLFHGRHPMRTSSLPDQPFTMRPKK